MSRIELPGFLRGANSSAPSTRLIDSTPARVVRTIRDWLDTPAALLPLPRVRLPGWFSLRLLIEVAAVVGIALGVAAYLRARRDHLLEQAMVDAEDQLTNNPQLRARRDHYLELANTHMAQRAGRYYALGSDGVCRSGRMDDRYRSKQENDLLLRKNQWHRELAAKYQQAADRPWLPVAADPPEPE